MAGGRDVGRHRTIVTKDANSIEKTWVRYGTSCAMGLRDCRHGELDEITESYI